MHAKAYLLHDLLQPNSNGVQVTPSQAPIPTAGKGEASMRAEPNANHQLTRNWSAAQHDIGDLHMCFSNRSGTCPLQLGVAADGLRGEPLG